MSTSPNLRLPYLDANQNQKSVTHNAALRMLDALVNLHVASAALSAPPATPNDGQCWIVASGGTGAWAGKDLNVAAWQDGAWSFYAPNPGTVAYVDALGGALVWNGTAWVSLLGAITALALNTLALGTTTDPTNPLSARLNAALFSALPTTASPAGTGDVRVKLSKQGAGNTASLLFQDSYAGRAEIGLVGDDNFHFKVSSDGATFVDAMVVAAAGGGTSFLLSPTAPTPAAGDSTTKLATTAFVTAAVGSGGGAVASVAGRTGAVTLAVADVAGAAALASPALTGIPTAPNAPAGTNTSQVATTAFARSNARRPGLFHVYRGATAQTGIVGFSKFQLDTKEYDLDGWYDNATTYRYTPLEAGYYLLYCGCQLTMGAATTDGAIVAIYKNGALARQSGPMFSLSSAICVSGAAEVMAMIYLNGTSDYVEFYVYTTPSGSSTSGSGTNSQYRNYAGGCKVSA